VKRRSADTASRGRSRHAETETDTIATQIAGLRWRLKRLGNLEHPAVLRELRKLDEQLAAQLELSGQASGRHRTRASRASGRRDTDQISDACGYELKPDPLSTTAPAEFIDCLWRYKAWSGDPSWRNMANRAGQVVVHSTIYAAMHGTALPKHDVVRAIITGCGGGNDDLVAFITAWRRLDAARTSASDRGTDLLAAPV
jgi:hypothetical protein